MGQSSSTDQPSPEQREAESLAASIGALPVLQKAFSILSDPQTNTIPIDSLQKCFRFTIDNSANEGTAVPKEFPILLSHLSSCIVDLFFFSGKGGGLSWVEFLKGYSRCCGRTIGSSLFNNLFRVFSMMNSKAGLPEKLQFAPDDDDECKINGYLLPIDILMLLWTCWVMWWDCKKLKSTASSVDSSLPDVTHLVLSAAESCVEDGAKLDLWECPILETKVQLPAAKITMWALKTLPNLTECLSQFVQVRLLYLVNNEDKSEQALPFVFNISTEENSISNLFTRGRAWAISLTLRSAMCEEISKACFSSSVDEIDEFILYRSSIHGKGLNRFWSRIEGYNGPLLILIAAYEPKNDTRKWIIGVLTHQGLENKDSFYGTSGSLYAISPAFHVFLSSGKEKNVVYSHLHPTVRMYEPRPKPVGLAFGGSSGNERIFLDEDFAVVTLRHHAVDKTYQPGSLFPGQGFLPLEASVVDVEVWGLGGKSAREVQTSYKKREELFTQQRRKVDLKTFGNWEDSPERMMMDMITDPNAARREDR